MNFLVFRQRVAEADRWSTQCVAGVRHLCVEVVCACGLIGVLEYVSQTTVTGKMTWFDVYE